MSEARTLRSDFVSGHLLRDIPANSHLVHGHSRTRLIIVSVILFYRGCLNEDMSMYVDVSVVTKTASIIIVMFCALSLIFGSLSHFQMVHPFVAVILILASGWFYGMGVLMQRKSESQ